MALTTASELLSTINILDPLEKTEAAKRHPKNEFQAYAYRLAHDLNDLNNLQIYMRLSKTFERSVMERAYSFVSDSSTNERGRLFLWKLKQIRNDLQKQRDLRNFEYDFVIKKMSKVRDIFKDNIKEKTELDLNKDFADRFSSSFEGIKSESKRSKPKVLILGYTSPQIVLSLKKLGYSIVLMDISKELVKYLKEFCGENGGVKFICKDFMKNSFEDNFFDLIFVNHFWSLVPFDFEIKFLGNLKKVLKSEGKLVINFKASNERKEEWKSLKFKGNDVEYYTKLYSENTLRDQLQTFAFNADLIG